MPTLSPTPHTLARSAALRSAAVAVLAALLAAAPGLAQNAPAKTAPRSVSKTATKPAPARQAQSLDRQIEALVERTKLGPVQVGVAVIDCTTGDTVASHNARTPLIPASNMKLLSSGTALLVLGKDFEFTTTLAREGDRLIVIGSGDPGFAEPDLLKAMKVSVGALLDRLVEAVTASGFTGIKEVVIDDRVFDRDAIHPTWPTDQLHRWYCAPVSGLNFHANILNVFPVAGDRPGPAPQPRTEPGAPWLEIVNQVQTVATGSTAIGAAREAALRFRVTGTIRATPIEPIDVTVQDPATLFARLLADRLAAAGLASPEGLAHRLAEPGEVLNPGPPIAVVRTPMDTALKRCNADSHNLYAEAFIKRVGHDVTGQPGSWGNGSTVIRMQVAEKIGQETGAMVIADGSGMSRENRVTPATLAAWLASLAKGPSASAFIDSLAKPGEGTLERRFQGKRLTGQVRAKSGYLRGVQCLSGYVTDPATGRRAAFSILVNNITSQTPAGKVKEFHEDVVDLVDQWLASPQGGGTDRLGG